MDMGIPGGYRTLIVLMNSFFYSRQTDILAGMVWFKTLIKRRHSNVLMVVRQDIFHSYLNAGIHSNAALNPVNADDSFTPSRARGYISDQQHSNAPFPCL